MKDKIERILKELEVETLDDELVNELLSLFNSNLKEQRELLEKKYGINK